MRYIAILLLSCCLSSVLAEPIKVMTFNLRYASMSSPNAWPDRRPVTKQCILQSDPDIIGTQEGLYHQVKDIHADIPQYSWIGLGREGGSKGEFMAVFYKTERFEPMEFDHYWLSDTPNVIGSATWGHSNRRMVTWVLFKDKKTSKLFYLLNTHFDHEVQTAREKAASLVRERIGALDQDIPLLLIGDFNAKAGDNKAYDILTADGFLKDTWHTAAEKRGRVVNTFHGFRGPREGDTRIDWILARGVKANWTEIVTCSLNGQYPSDHFPVIAEVELE